MAVDRLGRPLRDDPYRGNVRVYAASNITLSGLQTIDGVTLESGDRVLCNGQTTTPQNGIYVASNGVWSRSRDLSTSDDFTGPIIVTVEEGTTYRNTFWHMLPSTTITVGTDAVSFTSGYPAALIGDDSITDAKLRESAGLSVIGRSANTTGNPADITGTDGQVLRVSGTTLGFGTVATAGLADDAVTTAKIADGQITNSKISSLADLGDGILDVGFRGAFTGSYVDGQTPFGSGFAAGHVITDVTTATRGNSLATMSIATVDTGAGTNGPAFGKFALYLGSQKANYLTSDVEGEVGGGYDIVFQGRRGDSSGRLIGVSKVFGTGTDTGGIAGLEGSSRKLNTSGDTTDSVQYVLGFQQGAGGIGGDKAIGLFTERRGGAGGIGMYIGILNEGFAGAATPTWDDWLVFANSRASGDRVFTINRTSDGLSKLSMLSADANALRIGRDLNSPAFNINAAAASSATGWDITAAASGGGAFLSVLSPATNESGYIDARGSGSIVLGNTSTGSILLQRASTFAAGLTVSSVDITTAWATSTPTPTAASGTFTSVSSTVKYKRVGRVAFCNVLVSITTNGTAAGHISVTLPFTAQNITTCRGRNISTGTALQGAMSNGSSTLQIFNDDNTYPGADSTFLVVDVIAEIQ